MCSVGMRVPYFWPCFTILPWCWQTNVLHITHPPLSPRLIDTNTLLTLRAHLGFRFSLRFTLSPHATPYVWVHCSPLPTRLRQRLGCPPSERNTLRPIFSPSQGPPDTWEHPLWGWGQFWGRSAWNSFCPSNKLSWNFSINFRFCYRNRNISQSITWIYTEATTLELRKSSFSFFREVFHQSILRNSSSLWLTLQIFLPEFLLFFATFANLDAIVFTVLC